MIKSRIIMVAGLLLTIIGAGGWAIIQVTEKIASRSIIHENIAGRSPDLIAKKEQEQQGPSDKLPEPSKEITFLAVGDVMLSRTVADKMQRHGFDYPYEKVADLLQSADFVFGNLEMPIIEGRRIEAYEMVFRADPGAEQGLAKANFEIVSLANNHTMNFSNQGIENTFQLLDNAGINYCGAGMTKEQALQPALFRKDGLTLAFLCFTDTDVSPDSYGAKEQVSGVAFMNLDDLDSALENAREQADIIIVSTHSGNEYTEVINSSQSSFARHAIDMGADLVIGHHPHVVQKVEEYKDKQIIYSLGNFIFDQEWSQETKQGMTALITMNEQGVSDMAFQPVIIEDYSQPRLTDESETQSILDRLQFTFTKKDCDCGG
ncbi:MAG: CapA family protein [bacterium]